jgi:hypothetical protein
MLKIITYKDIKELKPCYDPIKYLKTAEWSGTLIDILNIEECSASDRLWVISHYLEEKQARLFMSRCARYAYNLLPAENQNKEVLSVIELVEQYGLGQITEEEFKNKRSAAESAAWSAAESATRATRAAESAAWLAAWSAAESTARLAGWSAAWSAAESAARSAAESAAESAAYAEFLSTLKNILSPISISKNKPDLSLIPYSAQVMEAEAFMVGAQKYTRYSFIESEKYKTASEHVAALKRHLDRWFWQREETDKEDGQPNLGSVRARAAMLIELIDRGLLIDDRPPAKNSKDK